MYTNNDPQPYTNSIVRKSKVITCLQGEKKAGKSSFKTKQRPRNNNLSNQGKEPGIDPIFSILF